MTTPPTPLAVAEKLAHLIDLYGIAEQQHEHCPALEERRARDRAKRQLTNAIAAALSQAVAQWQPIETAPKDGTWVLGWAQSDSAPYRISWGRNHRGEMSWCTQSFSFVGGYITHWMPLPALPAAIRAATPEGE